MAPARLQKEFLARIADPQDVRMILEHLPGVFFFMKDDQGRFMAANTATCVRCGLHGEHELIGRTDADFLPSEIAKAYREDDRKVIRTGKPLINRLELFYNEQQRLDWFLTTKLPLLDGRGQVIGVIGVARRDEKRMMHHDVLEVTAAVKFARDNCHRLSTAADLAKAVGVSERQLYRDLRAALGVSPYELLLRTRIQSAAEELAQTSAPIIEIALSHGFCDQSAFTQQFRKRIGQTPREFRLSHLG
ncbi:MAG TPA: helix-turn-helix domain-containing protein [Chthoniobacteraceae bacterium]|jgi:AraC-like DNA-binding protein